MAELDSNHVASCLGSSPSIQLSVPKKGLWGLPPAGLSELWRKGLSFPAQGQVVGLTSGEEMWVCKAWGDGVLLSTWAALNCSLVFRRLPPPSLISFK